MGYCNRLVSVAVLVATLLAGVTGCAHVRSGVHNALADATDIIRADLSFSFGTDMGGHVMLTKYAQLKSYSYEDLYRVGVNFRQLGLWQEEREDWWVGPRHARNMHVSADSVWLLAGTNLAAKMRAGEAAFEGFATESPDEVGVGLHLFVLGFRVGVRPVELADLFTSPFGLDLEHDDLSLGERRFMRAAAREARKAAKQPAPEPDVADGPPPPEPQGAPQ